MWVNMVNHLQAKLTIQNQCGSTPSSPVVMGMYAYARQVGTTKAICVLKRNSVTQYLIRFETCWIRAHRIASSLTGLIEGC